MDVFLVGGGWSDERAGDMFGGFVEAAAARSALEDPRILLVVTGSGAEDRGYHEKYVDALALVGVTNPVVARVGEGDVLPPDVLEGIDGLLVGGGRTPQYHASLRPAYPRIRELVAEGVPYAGFSAGAAIAATQAIVGGWLLDGQPVCPEDSNEELDDVSVVEGIGLVPGAVDVHAVQWGTLSRLVAVVEAGLAPSGMAIDECTTLLPDGSAVGAGRVWRVSGGPEGTVVTRS
jgi:cyanophycinase